MTRRFSLILLAVTCLSACDKKRSAPPEHLGKSTTPPVPWTPPKTIKSLVDPDVPTTSLDLPLPRRYPPCWEFLQKDGTVIEKLPAVDDTEFRWMMASCGLEARETLEDGTRILGWAGELIEGTRASTLHIGVWESSGELRWTTELDRSDERANWVANFRQSFVAVVPGLHVCFGTLWEGDTQVACADWKTGEKQWSGDLSFWSGMAPQPVSDGLVVADLTSMTKRYPFSGEEMKHRKLEGLGGRAGYYATDGKHLFFAASRDDAPPLVAYDLVTFKEAWRAPLPAGPASSMSLAFAEVQRGLMKIDQTLFAYDTETGKIAWGYEVGDDMPPVALHQGDFYLLHRRPEKPNQLVRIDAKSGERRWAADTPSGTLRVSTSGGALFIGSLHAVQEVELNDAGSTGEP